MRISQRAVFQVAERLTEAWWKVKSSSICPDTGEDMRVEIFERGGGRTRLYLDLQVKGYEGIERFLAEGDPDHLRYPMEVTHLEGWERSLRPVAILLWDVRERRGCWTLARDVCKRLDERSPGWRAQRHATLLIPMTSTADDAGLMRLREAVARDAPPKLAQPGEEIGIEMSVICSDDAEGRVKEKELREFWEGGRVLDIARTFISDPVVMHDDLRAVFGEEHWRRIGEIRLPSIPGDQAMPVRVEVESPLGAAHLPYVELRLAGSGARSRTVSNEQENAAVTLTFALDDEDTERVRLSIALALDDKDADDVRAAVWFALATTEPGGLLRIERLNTKADPWAVPCHVPAPEEKREALRRTHGLMERLCFLQDRVRKFGRFSAVFPAPRQQIRKALQLLEIVAGAEHHVMCKASISAKGTKEISIAATDGPLTFVVGGNVDGEEVVEVFGVRVPVGPVRLVITETRSFVDAYNSALRQALASSQETFRIEFACRARYLSWTPAGSIEDRLDALAKDQAGYFTADQARDVGGFAGYLDHLELRGKIETVAGGVFRMVNLPAASDVDDLVVLWLQSGKSAVFSHHTALVLHELSDVLPSRIHMTVPPTWTPAAPLPSHVVLHHAALDESDVAWHDVVPITTPLRTIQDCRAARLDPDLLDQACREGIERGMFLAEELARRNIAAAE